MLINSFVLLSLFSLSVSAKPHATPRGNDHRAIAARHAAAREEPGFDATKRDLTRRCKPRPPPVAKTSPPVVNAGTEPTTTQKAEPTTTKKEEPKPTTKKEEPKPTTHKPDPAPTQEAQKPKPPKDTSNGFMSGTQTGEGTYYYTGLTACGNYNKDTDFIVAVSHQLFDSYPGYNGANPNNNPICGKKIRASYQGKSVNVVVTDRCEGCALTDLDFTPSAFDQLSSNRGRLYGVTWTWA